MENLQARMTDFYGRFEARGRICFGTDPIKANHLMVREFYANTTETNFTDDLIVMVRGKQVHFDLSLINDYYGLPNADNEVHKVRKKEEGK